MSINAKYVFSPGNAPENIRLAADRPKSIDVKFDPPTLPNGNITRYIIYYTPLDDQDRAYQVGQVPSKPIREWMTYHMVGDKLNEGTKHVIVTDFVEPDTGYAVVIQAANIDGPGPYSVQHSIRKLLTHFYSHHNPISTGITGTMSRSREGPPKELLVEPLNQTSVDARWKPADAIEESPIGYEVIHWGASVIVV